MEHLVAIELDPTQVAFLTLCQQNYATISFMHMSDVFKIREGNATLHFGKTGKLLKIQRELYTYAPAENA